MSSSRRRFIQYAIVLPCLTFVAIACSSGNPANVAVNSQKASQTAEQPIKIRIAYPSGMNGQIATTMEKAGIANQQGLDA